MKASITLRYKKNYVIYEDDIVGDRVYIPEKFLEQIGFKVGCDEKGKRNKYTCTIRYEVNK